MEALNLVRTEEEEEYLRIIELSITTAEHEKQVRITKEETQLSLALNAIGNNSGVKDFGRYGVGKVIEKDQQYWNNRDKQKKVFYRIYKERMVEKGEEPLDTDYGLNFCALFVIYYLMYIYKSVQLWEYMDIISMIDRFRKSNPGIGLPIGEELPEDFLKFMLVDLGMSIQRIPVIKDGAPKYYTDCLIPELWGYGPTVPHILEHIVYQDITMHFQIALDGVFI